MPKLLVDLTIDRVDLVDEGANSEAFIKIYKRRNTEMNFEEIMKSLTDDQVAVITEELAKAKKEADTQCAKVKADLELETENAKTAMANEIAKAKSDAEASIAKAKEEVELAKAKDTNNTEDIIKSLDPAVQAIFKSMEDKKIAAEAIAKQMKAEQEKEEAISKAKDLKSLPVEEAKLVEIVKSISPEVFDILKAANKLIEDSEILKEKGNNSTGSNTDAWDKIEKAASEIAKRDSITKQKAITVVMKEQPELYKEYLKGGL